MKSTTMIRMITLGTLLGLIISGIPLGQADVAQARRKKKKKEYTGTFENRIYKDKKYGFSLEIPEGWGMKMGAKGANIRIVADKDEYSVPVAFRENEFLTAVPMVKVFVDTSSLNARDFIDSLKSKTFSSKQKKMIYNSFTIFDGKTKRPVVSRLKLTNGAKGMRARILRRYSLEVPRGVGKVSDIVSDNVQGDIAVFKSLDKKFIIVISGICESLFYRGVNEPIFEKIFQSLSLDGSANSTSVESK